MTLENNDPLLTNATTVAALPMAIARGIRYAVRHGAQVIDLPLDPAAVAADNAAAHGGTSAVTGGSPAERAAVTFALSKGVVLVAPAGDGGAGPDTINYPAAYPGVISVGAFNQGVRQGAVHQRPAVRHADRPGERRHRGQRADRLRQAEEHHRGQRGGGRRRGADPGAVPHA